MRSDEVMIHFPPIKLEKGVAFLKGLSGSMSSVINDFAKLDEEQMANYKYPSFVSETMREYRDGRYSKDSEGFKNFNSAVTAINILKSCARMNLAIYALKKKYEIMEMEAAKANPALSRYQYYLSNQYSVVNQYAYSEERKSLPYTSDADILQIKEAAINVRDKIHAYSKKHTVEGFEENFINTVKFGVYTICERFFVNTKTLTEKATETGSNIAGNIIAFVLFCFAFWLLAKCASGQ